MATKLKKKNIKKITKPSIKKKKVILVKKNKIPKKITKINKKKTTKKKISTKKIKKNSLSKKKIVKKKNKKRLIKKDDNKLKLKRSPQNPIMSPRPYSWESRAVFNPGALLSGGRVHLFYRALGDDGISRIGYASSLDGLDFKERLSYPIYFFNEAEEMKKHWPFTSPARPIYNRNLYSSGGGWGGCEDPRMVLMDGIIYMTINIFNGWNSMRVAVISIKEEDLLNKKWHWRDFSYLSHDGDRQKNWVLFPEKINNKYAIFHNLDMGDPTRVGISFVDKLDTSQTPKKEEAPDPQSLPNHIVTWHKRTRSAASPPIKTKDGWLLLYHAMDKDGTERYKLGALLLDLKDPTKVIYRGKKPILEPNEWYENDWKPGIIYANGAVVLGENLFVYYGGGDKYVGVASIKISDLLKSLKENKVIKLKKSNKVKIK